MKALLRFVSSSLGVSYNALASDLEGVNYSSMRSGLLIERDQWRMLQSLMKEQMLQPIFEDWISMVLLSRGAGARLSRPVPFLRRQMGAARLDVGGSAEGRTGRDSLDRRRPRLARRTRFRTGRRCRGNLRAAGQGEGPGRKVQAGVGHLREAPVVDKGPKDTVQEEDEAGATTDKSDKSAAPEPRRLIALGRSS